MGFVKTVKNKRISIGNQLNNIRRIVILKTKRRLKMENYICTVCHWVYEPAENNNVPFAELPEDYVCPLCGVGKDLFEVQE